MSISWAASRCWSFHLRLRARLVLSAYSFLTSICHYMQTRIYYQNLCKLCKQFINQQMLYLNIWEKCTHFYTIPKLHRDSFRVNECPSIHEVNECSTIHKVNECSTIHKVNECLTTSAMRSGFILSKCELLAFEFLMSNLKHTIRILNSLDRNI